MSPGSFANQIKKGWEILKNLDMHGEYISHPTYPNNPRAFFKGKSYQEIWKICLQSRFFHYQFNDDSIIYFGNDNMKEFNLSYYEFPFDAISYPEFVKSYNIELSEAGDTFREDYEVYLETCPLKESYNTIRYDLSYSQYVECRHPASHIHIGHLTNVRIGTKKILEPLSFLFFVLRQNYPDKWEEYLKSSDIKETINFTRNNLSTVNSKFLNNLDQCELYLF